MNGRELNKFSDSNNTGCCRCKHLLNIPRDLIQTSEKISDYTEECVDDLNFVQSMVWLKSATMFMKTISVEQFYSVFYKQWKNTGNDTRTRYLMFLTDISFNILNYLVRSSEISIEIYYRLFKYLFQITSCEFISSDG